RVFTRSDYARQAQDGVMEFLLINHPLDCPICDQGGECQLQDLAVGYGKSASRYTEEKRVVLNKNLGPLISTDMTRCIHCTRCVRFGQELAGVMELGMIGRGEHAEILAFVGKTVDSELSGNMIDLCPVGALTSKPFRYTARNWELSGRKSVSPHDSLGSNLIVQVKQNRVMRVLPLESEELNECWISDRDRFSYEGLNSEERLRRPMLKEGGRWREVDWQAAELAALDRVLLVGSFLRKDHPLVASRLRQIAKRKSQINVLHCADDDLLMPVANKAIVRPSELAGTLAQVVKAVAEARQKPSPAELAAFSVGGYLAGCVPSEGGLNARTLLEQPRKAYLLLNAEPDFDCHDPRTAIKAMGAADLVVAMAAYRSFAADYANVLLLIVPFTETSGTYVNCEGRMQSFNG